MLSPSSSAFYDSEQSNGMFTTPPSGWFFITDKNCYFSLANHINNGIFSPTHERSRERPRQGGGVWEIQEVQEKRSLEVGLKVPGRRWQQTPPSSHTLPPPPRTCAFRGNLLQQTPWGTCTLNRRVSKCMVTVACNTTCLQYNYRYVYVNTKNQDINHIITMTTPFWSLCIH